MGLINDTLKNPETGRYSRKSLTTLAAFSLAIVYEFLLPLQPWWEFTPNEYVWDGLLLLTGATLGLTVWDKKNNN